MEHKRKWNLTGAVETVKSDRLANKPVTSIASALTGEAAGVTVTQNSGQPDLIKVRYVFVVLVLGGCISFGFGGWSIHELK